MNACSRLSHPPGGNYVETDLFQHVQTKIIGSDFFLNLQILYILILLYFDLWLFLDL